MVYKKKGKTGYKKYNPKNKKTYYQKKEAKQATRREPGNHRTAIRELIDKPAIFLKDSQLIKNMVLYDPRVTMGTLASTPQVFYRANDLYDPYDGVGGHQPLGFDQMMLFYEQFIVIRSNISVTFNNPSTTNAYRVGIILSPDLGTVNYQSLIENGECVTGVVGPSTGSGNTKVLSLSCDVKNYFGRNTYREMMNDPDLRGNIATAPTELVHYGIFCLDPFDAVNENINFDLVITYDAIFYEPKKLSNS